jgi:ResB-like family.
MLYVQERRVWIWLKTESDGQAIRVAASSPRQSLEFEREFKSLELVLTTHPPGKAP